MAAFEGSQKSQLQGVSQQVPRERLEGQVSAQDNMLSDAVSGLRRRPGAELRQVMQLGTTRECVLGWSTDIGGRQVKLLLNLTDGILRIYTDDWQELKVMDANPYLVTSDRRNIRMTVVGDSLVIANVAVKPKLGATNPDVVDPTNKGFAFIRTGAFDRKYTISVGVEGGVLKDYTHTTPAATVTGAAQKAAPEQIAEELKTLIEADGYTVTAAGAFLFIQQAGAVKLRITTTAPATYIGVSNTSYIQTTGDLPSRLPPEAHGYPIAVGSLVDPTYYRYDTHRTAWLESGAYGSPGSLDDMPVLLKYTDGDWVYSAKYEGRLAGDGNSNPDPAFLNGITGIGSFQSRLVLLAGSQVCMSASNKPDRFYRTTINSLVASDPIGVGASANSSAAYEYCEPFQKDLLLFSQKYQALVPGGNAALTPTNASVVITSTYEADMASRPVAIGRTMMYPAPRSRDFYGVMEMVPSQYTDSQYLSEDVTAHLPKYLAGRCRFGVSSSVANIACFASTADHRVLYVHEYMWSGQEKVQQAWHRWTFPYDIADAFFSGADINLVMVNGANVAIATIDPRIGTLTRDAARRPFMDMFTDVTVADNVALIPPKLLQFDPTVGERLEMADTAMDLMGERVGVEERLQDRLITVPSFDVGSASMGLTYRSSFSPTTPMVKDHNNVVISSNKLTLLRYMIGTANSYEYNAIVRDSSMSGNGVDAEQMAVLFWGSAELDLGSPRVNTESVATIPCRTNASTTTLVLYTDGLGEMNIISMEYVCRFNQKLRRR